MRTRPDNPGKLDFASRVEQKVQGLLANMSMAPSTRRYNITMSHENKFIWYRVAKVGTRTIFARLRKSNTLLEVENASSILYAPNAYDDYFKFGFVRNPWDRLVSCWMNKVVDSNMFEFGDEQYEEMQDFGRFVDWVMTLDIETADRHLRSQSALIDLNHANFIGRMENFEEDAAYVFEKINVPQANALNANRNKRKKAYPSYYTDESIEKVGQIYRKDIAIFGYTF